MWECACELYVGIIVVTFDPNIRYKKGRFFCYRIITRDSIEKRRGFYVFKKKDR